MPALIMPGRAARGQRPEGVSSIHKGSPQASNLLRWWPVDARGVIERVTNVPAISGSTVSNSAPVPYGRPILGTGRRGVNGPQTYIDSIGLSPSFDHVSMTLWAMLDSTAGANSLMGSPSQFVLRSNGTTFQFTLNGAFDSFSAAHGLSAEVPFHLGVSYDRANVRFYVNGVLLTTDPQTAAAGSPGSSVFLLATHNNDAGAASQAGWDFRIYGRALPAADMWRLYDPATRWDLYWVPGRRVFFDVGAAGITAARARYMPLTGVA